MTARRRPVRRRKPARRPAAGGPQAPSRPQAPETPGPGTSWSRSLPAAVVIAAVTVLAYANSFSGPFIFDGDESITNNHYIRRLWPITEAMKAPPQATTSGRPLVCLSLAVNYAVSGLEVWSYHAFNLAVHVAAALLLFGIVRRTLLTERLRQRFGAWSVWLAGICASIWAVHPLLTQAVTYVIQRAESMMGMFYLLTLYCAIRSFSSRRRRLWYAAAAVGCAAGMATKEVMVTAPLMVLIYDWIFVGRSIKRILSRRWALYAALAVTWVVLAALVATGPRSQSAGFGVEAMTPLEYAQTQCRVVLHYLRLAFWPSPLVLDYTRKIVRRLKDCAPHGAVLLALLAGTVVALRYRPEVGFVGAWFFLILGPTSSFLPIIDPMFEHRMYLSLAGLVAGVVLGLFAAGRRIFSATRAGRVAGLALAAAAAGGLAFMTHDRNEDYRTAASIWRDTASKQRDNYRAFASLAADCANKGRFEEAIEAAGRSIELNPKFPYSYNSRGVAYESKGDHAAAIRDFTEAIKCYPQYARAYSNRAGALLNMHRPGPAVADATKAIELNPRYAPSYNIRGAAYAAKGMYDKAVADYDMAIRLDPRNVLAHVNRASAFGKAGDVNRALLDYQAAIRISPNNPNVYGSRGLFHANAGRLDQAVNDFRTAIRLAPKSPRYYNNLAVTLVKQGKDAEALDWYRRGLAVKPDWPMLLRNAAWLLATSADGGVRDGAEAVRLAERACRLTNYTYAEAVDTLAAAYAETGRWALAVETARKAVQLARAAGNGRLEAEARERLGLYLSGKVYRRPPGGVAGP